MKINKYNNFIKWIIHTRLGSFIGFYLGLSGYNRVSVLIIGPNGKIRSLRGSYNSRTNRGAALSASLMSGSTLGGISSPLPPKFIALSTNVLTPAAGDTTLSGETAATGLTRASGTIGNYTAPLSLDAGASYTVTNTFTNSSGGTVTLNSAALFDAVSSGNLFVEANFTQSVALTNTTLLQIQWTVNL